jgi:hypothetical protein
MKNVLISTEFQEKRFFFVAYLTRQIQSLQEACNLEFETKSNSVTRCMFPFKQIMNFTKIKYEKLATTGHHRHAFLISTTNGLNTATYECFR